MSKVKETTSGKSTSRRAITPEARESQLIALAVDEAERQLLNGTASSQVITHFLKLGTVRERKENLKLEKEIELLEAKTKSLESSARMEKLYETAISAFKDYGKSINSGDEFDED